MIMKICEVRYPILFNLSQKLDISKLEYGHCAENIDVGFEKGNEEEDSISSKIY